MGQMGKERTKTDGGRRGELSTPYAIRLDERGNVSRGGASGGEKRTEDVKGGWGGSESG